MVRKVGVSRIRVHGTKVRVKMSGGHGIRRNLSWLVAVIHRGSEVSCGRGRT